MYIFKPELDNYHNKNFYCNAGKICKIVKELKSGLVQVKFENDEILTVPKRYLTTTK